MERPYALEVALTTIMRADENAAARAYIESLERDAAQLKAAQAIAAEQAEDEALWCIPTSIVEAHFQQELRRLTVAVAGDAALGKG